MNGKPNSSAVQVTAIIFALIGLVLASGGIWLIALGGSWYYAIAGLLYILTAYFLFNQRSLALWTYAILTIGTLIWALWEVGIDWWPLASRGGVVVLFGALLLTPWITRPLKEGDLSGSGQGFSDGAHFQGGRLALIAVLSLSMVVAFASWFNDPHRIAGTMPEIRNAGAVETNDVPPGEWHAYGRTSFGRRYSPLDQVTPQNISELEVAWHYNTGDLRGQPGDPAETTYEVTPLKIDNRLYLCTPHQHVIALNATTGAEIWRYNPRIKDQLALQHLTCRGLGYYPGSETAGAPATQAPPPDLNAPQQTENSSTANLPLAAADRTSQCNAKLFMPTADGRIIALNPEDGTVCANFGDGSGQINLWNGMPNIRPGAYYSTSPPVVTSELIVVGGTVLDNVSTNEQSGVIRAYDVNSGALVWFWDPGNPEASAPLPAGETYSVNSPNSWSIMSADEELGLVYIPMGNQPPDQWGGNRSPSAERFSSTIVALVLATGQVRWVFQTVHHDIWDYDVPSQPTLVDLTIDGETVPALVQPTKQGEIFVLNRRTGDPILPVREVSVPQGAAEGDQAAPTQPFSAMSFAPPHVDGSHMWGLTLFDQLACRINFHQLRYDGIYTPPTTKGTLVHPGNFGVFNWGGIAVDPQRQTVFAAPSYMGFVSKLIPRENETELYVNEGPPEGSLPALNENFGAPFAVELNPFTSVLGIPCQAPPWGYVAGADLTTGKIVWRHKNGTVRDRSPIPLPLKMGVPSLGGPMVTGGGVAFLSGTLDYYIRGYDTATGEQLWSARLPAGGQATPMSYLGEDGRQYILVVAGGHGSLGTKKGDAVIAYALPKKN